MCGEGGILVKSDYFEGSSGGTSNIGILKERRVYAIVAVVDAESGAPVVGAKVSWDVRPPYVPKVQDVRSDSEGKARLGPVGSERTLAKVSCPGYRTMEVPVACGDAVNKIRLPRALAICGRVVGEDGGSGPGIRVVAMPARGVIPVAMTATAQGGMFRLYPVPPGTWKVVADGTVEGRELHVSGVAKAGEEGVVIKAK